VKIAAVDAIPLSIPFTYGGSAYRLGSQRALVLDMCLVRVETDTGVVGWGDAFAYSSRTAVATAVRDMVAPLAVGENAGEDANDIAALSGKLQKALHIFGRYGITMHALSGLDIALWDIAGKVAGKPLHALIGGNGRTIIPAYASLLRYMDATQVAKHAALAVSEGFAAIKLHETDEAVVAAARAAVPMDVPLTLDVNCAWTPDEALAICGRLAGHRPHWIEEPVFPPEDFVSQRRVGEATGVAIAAGENWCTELQFRHALDAGAVDIIQPSVIKVGGVTEFLKVLDLADARGVRVAPHSPYFGPGALATLHLLTRVGEPAWFELYYLEAEASLFGDALKATRGMMAIPQGPGLGFDPDPAVIERYRTDRG
jgi:L-alanine-DL-glutamate epimerase-like enolase superfamily enzyme